MHTDHQQKAVQEQYQTADKQKAVQEQYQTADKLNMRISLHTKYSTNPLGFGNWMFSQYDIFPSSRLLELGCGTGDLWKSKLHVLDPRTELTLTDFSESMVSITREALGERANISYAVVNIEAIPYADRSFDRIIANMMLYHVPNLNQGLSEVARVLKDDGIFYCAIYGENGMMPFLAGLLQDYGITDHTNKRFTLQNGAAILKQYFSQIQRLDYEDSLAVTDIDDVLDYASSLTSRSPIAGLKRQDVKAVLEKAMVNGVLTIPKEYGMFLCRK